MLRLVLICCQLLITARGNLLEVAEKCDNQMARYYLCDPYNVLSPSATRNIEETLKSIQLDTDCPCANKRDCYRLTTDLSGYTAGLVVLPPTDTASIPDSDMAKVYRKAELAASDSCDNGILLVYKSATKELFVRRGLLSYKPLNQEMELDMFNRSKSLLPNTELALVTLLNDYRLFLHKGPPAQKWSNISDVVGMIFGSLIAIVAVGGIFALFLVLCCNRSRSNGSDRVKILGGTNSRANSLSAASITSGKKPVAKGQISPDSAAYRGPPVMPQPIYDHTYMSFGSVKPGDSPRPQDSPSQAHLAPFSPIAAPDGRPISRGSGSFNGPSANLRGCETQTLKMKLTDA